MEPQAKRQPPRRPVDWIGVTVGLWTVLAVAGRSPSGRLVVSARCACGLERPIQAETLRAGLSRSCGCARAALVSASKTRHGHARRGANSAEFRLWASMLDRCGNPASTSFAAYGGRGIAVCDRWRGDFAAFLADMGRRPSLGHSIERINNDGPYAPENCRWATRREQGQNKRNSRHIEAFGERLSASEWARRTGLPRRTITSRLDAGFAPETALALGDARANRTKKIGEKNGYVQRRAADAQAA
jgi:hypothetical protein